MMALRSPASASPTKSQFFLLSKARDNKNYPQLSVMRRGEEFLSEMANDDEVFRPRREGATRHNYSWSRKCRSLSEGFAAKRLPRVGVSLSSVCLFISRS